MQVSAKGICCSAFLTIVALGGIECPGAPTGNREASWEFFNDSKVRVFEFEIPQAGLMSLQRSQRAYVKATVREGSVVLTNVGVRLKGMGSFRPVFEKPS